jgi:hypothetical protein
MKAVLLPCGLAGLLFLGALQQALADAPPCGQILATYRGVSTKSNGGDQFSEDDCDESSGAYGDQYQCVEFVKRFYAVALGADVSKWSGDAVDYFRTASAKGLIAFANGTTTTPPRPDDILVFSYSKTLGHVAIISSLSGNSVNFTEQNWSYSGTASLPFTVENGVYTITDRVSSKGAVFHVLGWLRRSPTFGITQPGPGVGKDIWTTSFYSYASCAGPGQGGGLYDDELRVGGWGDLYYSLLQFDLAGLPLHATSATLQVFCYSSNNGTPTPMYVDQVMAPWWNWQTIGTGCDHERLWWADLPLTTQLATLPAPAVGQWYSIDITGLYNSWQNNPASNYGLQLRPVSISDNFNFFYSSRATDDTLRPKLIIQQ